MNELIFIGIIISLLYTEITGISPGGIIVPAYFVLYIHDPVRMASTLVIALLCMGIVRLLSRFMILYGRRRYAVYLLTGIVLKAAAGLLFAGGVDFMLSLSLSIGYIIPGLLGREAERQGILPTFASLGIVTGILYLLRLVIV